MKFDPAQGEFEAMFAEELAPLKHHVDAEKRQAHKQNTSRKKNFQDQGIQQQNTDLET